MFQVMSYLTKDIPFNTYMILITEYNITWLNHLSCENSFSPLIFSYSSAILWSYILFTIQTGGTLWRYDSCPTKISSNFFPNHIFYRWIGDAGTIYDLDGCANLRVVSVDMWGSYFGLKCSCHTRQSIKTTPLSLCKT